MYTHKGAHQWIRDKQIPFLSSLYGTLRNLLQTLTSQSAISLTHPHPHPHRLPCSPLRAAAAAAVAAAYTDSKHDDASHDPQSDDQSFKVDWIIKK